MKKTKLLAPLLALVLILSSFSAFSLTVSASNDWTGEKIQTITAKDHLNSKDIFYVAPSTEIDETGIDTYQELAYAIQNYGTDAFPAQEIEITGDIDCENKQFENTIFGTLKDGIVIDGNGYALTNVVIYNWQGRGLFDVADKAHFVIKNLDFGTSDNMVQANLECGNWGSDIGIIIGRGTYGQATSFSFDITNVDMYLNATKASNQNNAFGGMIGKVQLSADSTITDCNVYGKLLHVDENGSSKQSTVAGFIGQLCTNLTDTVSTLTIDNCVNYATISGGNCTGSFVANAEGTINLVISDSVNLGSVTSQGKFVGGLVGSACNGANASFNNCVNLGNVIGSVDVGGFISRNTGDTVNTTNITVNNCINAANVTGTTADTKVSHFIVNGLENLTTVTNSYTLATATLTGTETAFEGNSTLASLDEVAAKMRELKLGYYTVQDGAVALDAKVPQLVGAQTSAVDGKTFNVRFVAVLKNSDLAQYSKVGFKVEAVCDNGETLNETKDSTVVFTSLNASVDGAMKTYENYELGGDYIMAIAWNGVPANNGEGANYTVTFKVTPYAVSLDGKTTYTGLSYDFTYVNGAKPASN